MFQQITIVGRLGRDPEMRYTPAGQAVSTFSVATDRQYTGQDGAVVKETTWFRVQVWGKMAEAVNNYLTKGKLVMVIGRLVCDPTTGGPKMWKGQDEFMHTNFEITASTVKFLSPREKEAVETETETAPEGSGEIPF